MAFWADKSATTRGRMGRRTTSAVVWACIKAAVSAVPPSEDLPHQHSLGHDAGRQVIGDFEGMNLAEPLAQVYQRRAYGGPGHFVPRRRVEAAQIAEHGRGMVEGGHLGLIGHDRIL